MKNQEFARPKRDIVKKKGAKDGETTQEERIEMFIRARNRWLLKDMDKDIEQYEYIRTPAFQLENLKIGPELENNEQLRKERDKQALIEYNKTAERKNNAKNPKVNINDVQKSTAIK